MRGKAWNPMKKTQKKEFELKRKIIEEGLNNNERITIGKQISRNKI